MKQPASSRRTWSGIKIVSFASIAVAAILIVSTLIVLKYPNPLLNKYLKPKVIELFSNAYPDYSLHIADIRYDVIKNRFDIDTIAVTNAQGTSLGKARSISIDGIRWKKMFFRGTTDIEDFRNVTVEVVDVYQHLSDGNYILRCARITVSIPDSEIVVESLNIQPNGDDEQFFSRSKFRQTRYRVSIPYSKIERCAVLQMIQGKSFIAGTVRIQRPFLDILVNKDKNDEQRTSPYQMPNVMLASIKEYVKIGNLRLNRLGLKYGERFTVRSKPALITLDSLDATVKGIDNHSNNRGAVDIQAEGSFMKSGSMNISMSIFTARPEFSLNYSGTLGRMNIRALNGFLEIAERVRVSGDIQSATFDVNVISGRATGSVRVIYSDLSLAFINSHSGSDKGVMNLLTSFIANTFKIRGNNLPDKKGNITIGKVNYARTNDNPFFQFVWFALRSGVKDVAGF